MTRRVAAFAAVVAGLAAAFWGLLGPFDLLTFLHAGREVLAGASPYVSATSSVFRAGHAFVYPLFVAWLFAPLAALPERIAVVVYVATSAVAVVAACRLLGRRGWAAPALLLASSTTIIGLQMGTVNAFLFVGLAGAWHWRRDHPVLSGMVLGVAATAKLFLLPVLAWPLIVRRWSSLGAAVGVVGSLLVASALGGQMDPAAYVHMLLRLDGNEQVSSWSLSSLFEGLGLGSTAATVATGLVVAACVAGVAARRRALSDGDVLGAVVAVSLLASPILWSSYLLLLAVPILLMTRRNTALAVAAVASWGLVTPDAASWPRVTAGLVLAVALAAWALWQVDWRRLPWRWMAAAGGGLTVAMLAAPAAARSPLPAVASIGLVTAACVAGRKARTSVVSRDG